MSSGFVSFDRFDGGVNSTNTPTALRDGELEEALNVYPYSRGSVRKVFGYEKWDANMNTGDPITGLYEFRMKDGTIHKLMVKGAAIYAWNSTTSTWTDVTGSASITNDQDALWWFADMNDVVYGCNGQDGIISWDGVSAGFAAFSKTNAPEDANGLFVWQNRLWFWGTVESSTYYPMRVRSSKNGDATTYDAQDFADVDGAFGGREIVRIFPDLNNLAYVFCDPTGVYTLEWAISTDTLNTNIIINTITHSWGVAGGHTVDLIGNVFCFYASDKKLRGWDYRDLSQARLIEIAGKDDEFFKYVRHDRARSFVGLNIPEIRQYWLCCTYDPQGSTITANNRVLAIQLYGDIRVDDPDAADKFTCWRQTRSINCMTRWTRSTGGFELVSGSELGMLYLQNSSDGFDGGIIQSFITSRPNNEDIGNLKKWDRLIVYTRALGTHTLYLNVMDETGKTHRTMEAILGEAAAEWDTGEWDDAALDGGGVHRNVFGLDFWSEYIKVQIYNSDVDAPFELLRVVASYSATKEFDAGTSTVFA